MDLGLRHRGRALQEVEVAAFVGLRDVARVERAVATRVRELGPLPGSAAARQLLVRDAQAEPARGNVQLDVRTSKADYAAFRRRRDAELEMPVLILPSVQVNIRAGELPPPETNGVRYLKLPINRLGG